MPSKKKKNTIFIEELFKPIAYLHTVPIHGNVTQMGRVYM